MQEKLSEVQRRVGKERWKSFAIDILKSGNTFALARKYSISLWDVRLAKMWNSEIALHFLEDNNKAVILPFTQKKVA